MEGKKGTQQTGVLEINALGNYLLSGINSQKLC